MKPILVLAPEQPGAPSMERGHVDFCRVAPTEKLCAGDDAYDSVIVINDGGADTIRRVRMALGLRGRGKPLYVGVLTYLAESAAGAADARPDWPALWPELRVELKEAMLSLEYQVD